MKLCLEGRSALPPLPPTCAAQRLTQLREALQADLAGYPLGGLLDSFMASADRPEREYRMLLFLLHEWAELLRRDTEALPAVEHELVRQVRERMLRSRVALLRLHDAFYQVGRRSPCAEGVTSLS